MKFEETIQACFDHYPDLFQTREKVLDQLFCTIGNGYDWINGELVENDKEKPINALDEKGKAKQYNIITKGDHRKSMYEEILNEPKFLEIWNNLLLKNGETLEEHFLSPKDNDEEVQYEVRHSVYPLCLKYSYLFNYPEDIKEDWLEGIKETYEYIINYVEEDSKVDRDIKIFREISKQDLIKLYNDKFGKK